MMYDTVTAACVLRVNKVSITAMYTVVRRVGVPCVRMAAASCVAACVILTFHLMKA